MRLLAHLSPLLLIALVLMTVLASVLGASIGIGWVLSQLVAFTLYQGTFVGFLALAASALMVSRLRASVMSCPRRVVLAVMSCPRRWVAAVMSWPRCVVA